MGMAAYIWEMVARVQPPDGEYRVVLSTEVVEALGLFEGAGVEIAKLDLQDSGHSYVSTEEAMDAFERILPKHEAAFRELAKGPGWKAPWWQVEESESK